MNDNMWNIPPIRIGEAFDPVAYQAQQLNNRPYIWNPDRFEVFHLRESLASAMLHAGKDAQFVRENLQGAVDAVMVGYEIANDR